MKKLFIISVLLVLYSAAEAQAVKPATELYDLVKKLLPDSTGFEMVGDWAVDQPKKYPVQWKNDGIVMSPDTSINFYRTGTANLAINGKAMKQGTEPTKWNLMLRGPRMGFTSFSLLSSPVNMLHPRYTLDSLFGKRAFTASLLKTCDQKEVAGYYYYKVKLPKKNVAYMKISWLAMNGNTAIRIDCFDDFSQYAVKLNCR